MYILLDLKKIYQGLVINKKNASIHAFLGAALN